MVQINNLKALAYGFELNAYQKVLARNELISLNNRVDRLESDNAKMLELLQEFEEMCNKKQFPTETTLREMRNKARQLIKEATEL